LEEQVDAGKSQKAVADNADNLGGRSSRFH